MKSLVVLLSVLFFTLLGNAAEPKPITVAAGREFKIALESNPSTGNQWLIARPLDDNLLKLLGTEYKRGGTGAGSVGKDVLSFKALAEGKTQIHLKYGRLFERDAGPTRSTNFVVVISRTGAAEH
jgi:predicted secreted protein